MKIGILSFTSPKKRALKEEYRLVEEAKKLGHKARIFRKARCQLVYDSKSQRVLYDGKKFPERDVIITRPSFLSSVDLNTTVIKQLQYMGFTIFNDSKSIKRAKNKLKTLQILDHKKIPVPDTVVVSHLKYLDFAIKKVGGPPVIIKTPYGSYGSGVVIAESKRAIYSALDAIWGSGSNYFLIQAFLKKSKGKDTRVFVVGGKVVGAMTRIAKRGEFRSNLELGGTSEGVEVSPEYKKIAIDATDSLGLQVAGVDIIETEEGPAVLEVNANPGFKGLEESTGLNIAGEMIKFAEKYVEKVKKET